MSEELLESKSVSEHILLPAPNNHEGGEDTPMGVSYGKNMMWYFLLSDAFTFTGLILGYTTTRLMADWWPDPNHVFSGMPFGIEAPLGFVSIMTFILILSSVFVVRAVQEGQMMNKYGVAKWMTLAILGGIAFLGCQAWEWSHLIHDGMSPFYDIFYQGPNGETLKLALSQKASTPVSPGPVMFGSAFFGITGFHGLHVSIGVVLNTIALIKTLNGTYERRGHYEMIEKYGLYWHFVDLVWIFVFLFFYLI